MPDSRFVKRLQKKARKGMRGWPLATIAFYGPNLSQATKVAVGIIPSENADVSQIRDWKVEYGDVRNDPTIAREILEFIQEHGAISVAMSDGIMGCPHRKVSTTKVNGVRCATFGAVEIDLQARCFNETN
jgi:hypothetical protein